MNKVVLLIVVGCVLAMACAAPARTPRDAHAFFEVTVACPDDRVLRVSFRPGRDCADGDHDRCIKCTVEFNGRNRPDVATEQCKAFSRAAVSQGLWLVTDKPDPFLASYATTVGYLLEPPRPTAVRVISPQPAGCSRAYVVQREYFPPAVGVD